MAKLTERGDRVVRLVRRTPEPGADEIEWDVPAGRLDAASLEGLDAVVHLAGAGIGDRRWNDDYKRLLVDSRVQSTALLAEAIASLDSRPAVFLSGSAMGFYGDRGDEQLDESAPGGSGFLADLVAQWEAAAQPAVAAGVRTAFLRTSIVLDPDSGALAKMLPLFRLGLGGRFGSGRQWMSWITLADEVGAIIHLLGSSDSGPVNLVAPEPVTNADFTKALGSALGRPTLLPVPAFGPRLLLGREMADALLFDSARLVPRTLLASGYAFAHPDVEQALEAIL